MGKTREDISHDMEIISIGKLYSGPWDKKYWSSSRGKDRYPYPVGYQSVRIENGVTYKMEILEGLKGPSFMISSTDGKSCSGDTPDIAWKNFQKKGCSGIKLSHGKRFSCKIDGLELYGFKNAFVQRLLRELVANVSGIDQSLSTSNFSSRAPDKVNKLQPEEPNPALPSCLVKPHVTGKRSRNSKVANTKRLDETHFKHQPGECKQRNSAKNSRRRDQSNSGGGDPSTFSAENAVSQFCGLIESGSANLADIVDSTNGLSIAERGLQLDPINSSDHLNVGDVLTQEERELTRSGHHSKLDAENILKDQHTSEKSRSISSIAEEKHGVIAGQHGMPILNDANLCVPDTLDYAGDSFPELSLNNHIQIACTAKDAIVNDVFNCDTQVTDSHPEEKIGASAPNTFSEKYDTDSAGEEVANSMMALLLPRAIPLLKTFSKKRKKSPKPMHISVSGYLEEKNMSISGTEDSFLSRELAQKSGSEGQKETADIPCVVPDSFDNGGPHDLFPHTSEADKASDGLDTCAQLPIGINGEATSLACLIETREHEINLHCEAKTSLTEKPHKENEITANPKRARSNYHSVDNLPDIPVSTVTDSSRSESRVCRIITDVGMPEISEARCARKLPKDRDSAGIDFPSSNVQQSSSNYYHNMGVNSELRDGSRLNKQQSTLNGNLGGHLEIFGCYVLPKPVSMVQLIVMDNWIHICLTSSLDHKEAILFVYKVQKIGENLGCPFLIGHLPISLQSSKCALGDDIQPDSSLLQFTPDAQSLVLIRNIKTPYCREGKLHCICPACTSDCFEKKAVKIVHINRGYVSIVTRLETTQDVQCLLVCEPNILLAAEEGGKLKLWVMNSHWSAPEEHWYLPTSDYMTPCLVELKRVPRSAVLVVGHNGFGEFGLWNIDERILVSRFSSPDTKVSQCVPVGLFRWQRNGEHERKKLVNEVMGATQKWFTERSENLIVSPDNKDVAIWLLISTASDPDSQSDQSSEPQANLVESWKLGLLINNTVIIGSILDSGSAAAVTSAGHGIIGRRDGLVYMWELSTGKKLGNLHSFKGTGVSSITTDTTNSGAVAIASGSQLLVCMSSSRIMQ